jgi:hypothetical protein
MPSDKFGITVRVVSENSSNPCEKTILHEIVGEPESISDKFITYDCEVSSD